MAQSEPAGADHRQGAQAGILMMITAVTCLSVMEAIAKYLSADYPVPMIVWARYAFHTAFAAAFFLDRRRWPHLKTGRPVLHTVRSLIMFTATALFFLGISQLPLADATAVVFGAPLYVALLSFLILGERVGPARILAVVVGFVGILVVVRPGPGFTNWAILLPVGAGMGYALFQICTRLLARTESVWTMFFYTPIAGLVAITIAVPFYWQTPDLEGWLLMAAAGCAGGAGQYFLARAFMLAEASAVAPFIYVQIVGATFFGFVVFGDLPDIWTIAGTAIVIGSGIFLWYRERRAQRRALAMAPEPRDG